VENANKQLHFNRYFASFVGIESSEQKKNKNNFRAQP